MKKYVILFLIIKIPFVNCDQEDRNPSKIPVRFYPCHLKAATKSVDIFLSEVEKEAERKKLTKEAIYFENDGQDWTPLHWACQENNDDVVSLYAVTYPEKEFHKLKAKCGVTPFGLAYKKDNKNLIKILTIHEFTRLMIKKLKEFNYEYDLDSLQYASERVVSQFELEHKLEHFNIETILFDRFLQACLETLLKDLE